MTLITTSLQRQHKKCKKKGFCLVHSNYRHHFASDRKDAQADFVLMFNSLSMLHAESNGAGRASGWGVGGTEVVLASYFPSHVTQVWITFKTR